MSEAAVELAHRFFDAFDKHDESALLELVHPEVEFTSLIVEVEGRGFHGHEGVRRYLREVFTVFPDLRLQVEDLRPIATGGVVVRLRVRASGVTSGASTDLVDWQAMTLRDGKAIWWAFFRTETEAIEATLTGRSVALSLPLLAESPPPLGVASGAF